MSREKELLKYCQHFIKEQLISYSEAVYHNDSVITNAYEFIEGICEIVGYYDEDSKEENK